MPRRLEIPRQNRTSPRIRTHPPRDIKRAAGFVPFLHQSRRDPGFAIDAAIGVSYDSPRFAFNCLRTTRGPSIASSTRIVMPFVSPHFAARLAAPHLAAYFAAYFAANLAAHRVAPVRPLRRLSIAAVACAALLNAGAAVA
ncbi:hypothetical protein, partial [Burkholderia sp. Ac-20353]|uniref:hypothetical protein n=1 Tax=Burkholderia sp. Ac-20353 TaxID=2703894 RepID=UPI00197C990E